MIVNIGKMTDCLLLLFFDFGVEKFRHNRDENNLTINQGLLVYMNDSLNDS